MDEDGNRRSIVARLKAELDEAYRLNVAASAGLESITKEVRSGVLQTNGSIRIRDASAKMKAATDKYRRAVNRYTNFTVRGVLPEDSE